MYIYGYLVITRYDLSIWRNALRFKALLEYTNPMLYEYVLAKLITVRVAVLFLFPISNAP